MMNVGSLRTWEVLHVYFLCAFLFFLVPYSCFLKLEAYVFLCWKLKWCAYYTVISMMYLVKEGVYRYGPTILGLHSECMRMYRPYRPFVIGCLCVS